MKIIEPKVDAKTQQKLLTVSDLIDGIQEALGKTNGKISQERQHSVESHLRACLRILGYKPRETAEKPATIPDLAGQLESVMEDTKEVSRETHDHLHLHLRATHSNCQAEVGLKVAPQLREVPTGKSSDKTPEPSPLTAKFIKQYENATEPELKEVLATANEVLSKDPNRKDAQAVKEAVNQLLAKIRPS